jgi:serine/threonine-protein kinase
MVQAVWAHAFVEDANLTVAISHLRKALGQNGEPQEYIETIPRVGYRFVADVREVREEAPSLIIEKLTLSRTVIEEEEIETGLSETTTGAVTIREESGKSRAAIFARFESKPVWKARWLMVALPVVLIGLIIALVYVFAGRKSSEVEAASEVKSLAVLPFRPMGSESEDETLELGLADTLITRLSSLREIKVRPTSAVLKYDKGD